MLLRVSQRLIGVLPGLDSVSFLRVARAALHERGLLELVVMDIVIWIDIVSLLVFSSGVISILGSRFGLWDELELDADFADCLLGQRRVLLDVALAQNAAGGWIHEAVGVEGIYVVPLDDFLRGVDVPEQLPHFQIYIAQIFDIAVICFALQFQLDRDAVIRDDCGRPRRCRTPIDHLH